MCLQNFKILVTAAGVVLSFLTLPTHAHDLPRLWSVEGPAGRMLVLGISHAGTPLQSDSYYNHVIVPNYDKADALYFEAVNTEAGKNTSCAVPSDFAEDTEGEKTLTLAKSIVSESTFLNFENTLEMFPHLFPNMPSKDRRAASAKAQTNEMTDFDLWVRLTFSSTPQEVTKAIANGIDVSGGFSPVVDLLRQRNPKQGKGKEWISVADKLTAEGVYSIETQNDWWQAFCAVGKKRWPILADEISNRQWLQSYTSTPGGWELRLENIDRLMKESFETKNSNLPKTLPQSMSRETAQFVCNRTSIWIDRMEGASRKYKLPFFAFGAAHIFDFIDGDFRCKGVISLLEGRGYTVSLVQADDHLGQ